MVATGSFGGWPEPPADAGVVRGMDGIRLEPARPNPAASTATFTFEMPATARVRLTVHDASGRTVAVLAEGVFGAGRHTTVWDASGFPSGIYACRMETDRAVTVRRIALIH
jgi:hypothetical protein